MRRQQPQIGLFVFSVIVVAALFSVASAQTPLNAEDLLRQMTLEEEEKGRPTLRATGFPIPEFQQHFGAKPEDVAR